MVILYHKTFSLLFFLYFYNRILIVDINLINKQMDFISGILGAVLISFIITIIRVVFSIGSKTKSDSNFIQKFTGTCMVLIIIVIIGIISEKLGCSSEDELDYPMKYQPD